MDGINGFLNLNKPRAITSMDAVAIVRRRAGMAKTGHAGTLDPLATGVLVIAIGKATKLIEQFMNTTKRYRTVIDLTAFTTTDDLEGARSEISVASTPSERALRDAVADFVGETMQQPPVYSALKVGGKRAYKLARKGESVELEPRPVRMHELRIIQYKWPQVEIAIHCDKGFYVRSFARDLGRKLGTGGHCVSIERTAVGPFTLQDATPIDALPEMITQMDVMSIEQALARLRQTS